MSRFIHGGLGFALLFAEASSACSSSDPRPIDETISKVGAESTPTYEEFRDSLKWNQEFGFWLVEGDIAIHDESELNSYYEHHYSAPGALIVNRKSSGTVDDIWSRSDRLNLTYCVSQSAFGSDYATVVNNTRLAASAWENVANVRFVHVSAEDSNCTTSNNNVKFNVAKDATVGDPCSMGYPSTPRANRQFIVNWNLCGQDTRERIGWTIHELGHGLGFRHEHFVVPGTTPDCMEGGSYRQVTAYDSLSVMHYPFCPGSTNDTGGGVFNYMFITQRDTDGAQALYEAPTNVVDLWDGTIFARKQSDGKLYRKSGSTWTQASTAATAFVAISNNLYRLSLGQVEHYDGGTSWSAVSGAGTVQQLFHCASKLCATNTNQDILRLSGATWTVIGGAGNRHATTFSGSIYGLNSKELSEWVYSGSLAWTKVGSNGYADLFADLSNVYGLLQDRSAVQRYTGGTNWTTIGGSGRQWLGVGSYLYALNEDAMSVWQYSAGSNTWTNVGSTATARLYGSNGILFATGADAVTIWQRINSWTLVGHP